MDNKTFIQAFIGMEDIKLLGQDKNGFRYYLYKNWVYQQYPETDFWVNGSNMKDRLNGYICNVSAWERTMHKRIIGGIL